MRYTWCAIALLAGLAAGCEADALGPEWRKPFGFAIWEPTTDAVVVASSLTKLAGDGQLYLGDARGTVGRSWAEKLDHLGLEARIDEGDCVHSATPDGHKFTINVYTTAEEPGVTGEQTRAYLHWEDKDYSTRGWQVLAELERRPTNAAH
jgi:hypothetical protein